MSASADMVELSRRAADGISVALDQDVHTFELPERMAWLVMLLRRCADRPEWFPRGKWATIQNIEGQLNACVDQWIRDKRGIKDNDQFVDEYDKDPSP